MIKDLIKLADFLDQHQKKQMADAVDQMVESLVKDDAPLRSNPKSIAPTEAPNPFYVKPKNQGDISGEWNTLDYLEPEDLDTQIMDPAEMVGQHKPSKGIINAVQQILSKWKQHPISIKWHVPGTGPGIFPQEEEEGTPPYWIVIARSDDPTDVPDDNYWSMWEVTPNDDAWEAGVPIEGKQTRLYGEW